MQKRNALLIALVALAAGTVTLVHLWDTQPWLFYEEVRIARNLRRQGANVKLADHRIVEVTFDHAPATDDALTLVGGLRYLETLKLNSEWHHERGDPFETSKSNIGDAGLLSLKGLPSLRHVSMNLDGTEVTAVGLECFRSLNNVEYLQVDFNAAASTQDGLQCSQNGPDRVLNLVAPLAERHESFCCCLRVGTRRSSLLYLAVGSGNDVRMAENNACHFSTISSPSMGWRPMYFPFRAVASFLSRMRSPMILRSNWVNDDWMFSVSGPGQAEVRP